MSIRFSIIVVCFNAGEKLPSTIKNIMEQTYDGFEIIVKDGGSTDGSLARLPKDNRIKVTVCEDHGIYDAMNQAIALAKGDYDIFMNCGDTFHANDVLERTAGRIESDRQEQLETMIYYGDTYNELEQAVVYMNTKITPFTCYRHVPCHQACFYAKELLRERGYDTSFSVRADYEHFLWSYFVRQVMPKHLGFIVADYEGGGFSESRENCRRDQKEHKEITERYMKKRQLMKYRLVMILTLVSLRRFLSKQKGFSKLYHGMKKILYRS